MAKVIENDSANLSDKQKLFISQMKARGVTRNNLLVGRDHVPSAYVPTGIPEIDAKLGDVHGLPDGTVVEICGKSQSGKTHVALSAAGQAQKRLILEKSDKRIGFLNVENTFYAPRAKAIGVDVDNPNFEVWQDVGAGEDWGDLLEAMIATGDYLMVIVDSIKALIPRDAMDKSFGQERKFAGHASLIERIMQKTLYHCSRTKTTALMINQLRVTGVKRGIQTDYVDAASGGAAMDYYTHTRLWVNRIGGDAGKIMGVGEDGEITVIGGRSRLNVFKSRFGGGGNVVDFPIMFNATEGNALAEFVFRLLRHTATKDYVSRSGRGAEKKYKYIDTATGEVLVQEPLDWQFVQGILTAPPPSKIPRGVKADTAFEYFCNRLKIDEDGQQRIIEKFQAYLSGELTSDSSDDEEDDELTITEE